MDIRMRIHENLNKSCDAGHTDFTMCEPDTLIFGARGLAARSPAAARRLKGVSLLPADAPEEALLALK
jgi:hypothetical protein